MIYSNIHMMRCAADAFERAITQIHPIKHSVAWEAWAVTLGHHWSSIATQLDQGQTIVASPSIKRLLVEMQRRRKPLTELQAANLVADAIAGVDALYQEQPDNTQTDLVYARKLVDLAITDLLYRRIFSWSINVSTPVGPGVEWFDFEQGRIIMEWKDIEHGEIELKILLMEPAQWLGGG